MPLHDWTRVPSGLFQHFHQNWTVTICSALNKGRLPDGLTALVEQKTGSKETDVLAVEEDETGHWNTGGGTATLERPATRIVRQTEKSFYADRANRIAIRHHLGRIVSLIEIVSPGNKDGTRPFREFVDKMAASLEAGIHLLVIDPFPPTSRDPFGIHKAIWDSFEEEDFDAAGKDRVLASYEAGDTKTACVETVAVGEELPDMPLFIGPGRHIKVPLEASYLAAWENTPPAVRRFLVP